MNIYRNVPYGEEKPESYIQEISKSPYIRPNVLDELARLHHNPSTLTNYRYFSFKDSSIITVSEVISHRDPAFNKLKSMKAFSDIDEVEKVIGYYLAKPDGSLMSLLDIFSNFTEKEVVFYSYIQNLQGVDHSALVNIYGNGNDDYYIILLELPESLGSLLGFLHEVGHVIANETQELNYRASFLRDVVNGSSRRKDENVFESYMMDQIIQEVDAWSATVWLIKELDLECVFETNSQEFLDYIWYCIKTRIP